MKEIRHEGRFIVGPYDRIARDGRNLADQVEDWLDSSVAFRGGLSETSPIERFHAIMQKNPEALPPDQLERIVRVLSQHRENAKRLRETLEQRVQKRLEDLRGWDK